MDLRRPRNNAQPYLPSPTAWNGNYQEFRQLLDYIRLLETRITQLENERKPDTNSGQLAEADGQLAVPAGGSGSSESELDRQHAGRVERPILQDSAETVV